MKLELALLTLISLAGNLLAAQPQLKTLQATWDQYPLTNYPGGSNGVITLYKSTLLGTVWSPFKPTTITPATRTNQFFQVVSPNTFQFYATTTLQPYGESDPSSPIIQLTVSPSMTLSRSFSLSPKQGAERTAVAAPRPAVEKSRTRVRLAAPKAVQTRTREPLPFTPGSRFGSRDPFSPHQYYIKQP